MSAVNICDISFKSANFIDVFNIMVKGTGAGADVRRLSHDHAKFAPPRDASCAVSLWHALAPSTRARHTARLRVHSRPLPALYISAAAARPHPPTPPQQPPSTLSPYLTDCRQNTINPYSVDNMKLDAPSNWSWTLDGNNADHIPQWIIYKIRPFPK